MSQTHDSVLLMAPKDNRNDVMKNLFPLLETELYINGHRVIVAWEAMAGPHWYKKEMDHLGISRKSVEV